MNWKAMVVAFAGAAGLLFLLVFGLSHDPRAVPTPMIGNPAPEFALETLSGDTLHLSKAGDLPLVINFWASWCVPCQEEHPLLVALNQEYRGQVRLIGVVYQDTRANANEWYRQRGGDWTNVLDPGSKTAIEFGVRGVPETFFVSRDRRILHHQPGPVTPELLRYWMPRLQAGKDSAKAPRT